MITQEQIKLICFVQIVPKWRAMPDTFPDFLPVVSQEEKASNEMRFFRLQRCLQGMPKNPSEDQKLAIKAEIKKEIRQFLAEDYEARAEVFPQECPSCGETDSSLRPPYAEALPTGRQPYGGRPSEELLSEFESSIEAFLNRAKAFDEMISAESLWQALRNYLIYAVISNLQGKPQNCHDAIVGYSLLYPYTDNYIDARRRTNADKNAYHDLIRSTLSGMDTNPVSDHERKTKQLLLLVLDHYASDVSKRQDAASLLLLMLQAQEKSMLQIHRFGTKKLAADEILRISSYKGGLSVLLDYMVSIGFDRSKVTEDEMYFYLAFGLVLQLADDLQDLEEDRKKHAQTLATICRGKKARERFANKLFHFAWDCISGFSPRNPKLHRFILRNCQTMLLVSAAQNTKYFSKRYLEMLEPYLPVSLSYIKRVGGKGMVGA